ncbi:MAG: hypothetical protein F4138_02075 [Acidimicrobiia bacterium]|nr:hypothetical protein [Acidimicrobiia bacterium]
MTVFMVHISHNLEETHKLIYEHYPEPDRYSLADNAFLIRDDTIAQSVATKIGLDGNSEAQGVVFRLNASYGGFDNRAIWDWLSHAENAALRR